MEARAIAKGLRIPPRKARLIVDLIRGKDVQKADEIVSNYNSEAARLTKKVLTSAVANALNNLGLDKTKLYVKEAYVNEGQTLKRMIKKNEIWFTWTRRSNQKKNKSYNNSCK